MEENRLILTDELSYTPIRTRLDRIECKYCAKHFYVDHNVSPEVCPFCVAGIRKPFSCSKTGSLLTSEDVMKLTPCRVLGYKRVACVECEHLIRIE